MRRRSFGSWTPPGKRSPSTTGWASSPPEPPRPSCGASPPTGRRSGRACGGSSRSCDRRAWSSWAPGRSRSRRPATGRRSCAPPRRTSPGALANHRYSADVVAIAGAGEVLASVPDLASDNALPRWLAEAAAIPVRDLATRRRLAMDVDSPLDLVLLEGARGAPRLPGPDHPSAALVRDRLAALRAVAADPGAELLVAGRTSATDLRWLERHTRSRTRALVEERGLRTSAAGAAARAPEPAAAPERAGRAAGAGRSRLARAARRGHLRRRADRLPGPDGPPARRRRGRLADGRGPLRLRPPARRTGSTTRGCASSRPRPETRRSRSCSAVTGSSGRGCGWRFGRRARSRDRGPVRSTRWTTIETDPWRRSSATRSPTPSRSARTRCSSSGSAPRSRRRDRSRSPGSWPVPCMSPGTATTGGPIPAPVRPATSSPPPRPTRSSAPRSAGCSRRRGRRSGVRCPSRSSSTARAPARSRRACWSRFETPAPRCSRRSATGRWRSSSRGSRRSARGSTRPDLERGALDAGDALADGAPAVGAVVANEVLDALPVHRVIGRPGGIREQLVGLDAAGGFAWVEADPTTAELAERLGDEGIELEDGQAAEVCLGVETWLAGAVDGLDRGVVVLVDYAEEPASLYAPRRRDGTLRGFARHGVGGDPFRHLGRQDLTATVDLAAVRAAAARAGLEPVGETTQAELLAATTRRPRRVDPPPARRHARGRPAPAVRPRPAARPARHGRLPRPGLRTGAAGRRGAAWPAPAAGARTAAAGSPRLSTQRSGGGAVGPALRTGSQARDRC